VVVSVRERRARRATSPRAAARSGSRRRRGDRPLRELGFGRGEAFFAASASMSLFGVACATRIDGAGRIDGQGTRRHGAVRALVPMVKWVSGTAQSLC
jgi:hypothetical protein